MNPKIPLATLALLMIAPSVAADHWNDDTSTAYFGDSTCTMSTVDDNPQCPLAYACTGGSPPQVVDTALHCSGRAASESGDIVSSVSYYAWTLADSYTLTVHNNYEAIAATAQPAADEFNTVGCSTIWSFFCTNPVIVPADVPMNDPVNGYPGALP